MVSALKLFVNLLLPQLLWAQAQINCHPKFLDQVDQVPGVISVCEKQSDAQGREFLKWKIGEDHRVCRSLHRSVTDEGYLQCVRSLIAEAHEVLTCTESLKRYRETVESDVREMKVRLSRFEMAEAPARIEAIFAQLTAAADRFFKYKFEKPVWALHAYQDQIPNATAGIGGDILISNAVWSSEKGFPENEIAAILAHEISHVVRDHMMSLGCLAIEWIGPHMTVGDALEAFLEDFSDGFPRKEKWKKVSQSLEFEADRIGIEVLRLAGYDENSMVQVLKRLKSQASEGFSSGSHPEFDERIRKAEEAVKVSKRSSYTSFLQ